jgi:hypothetical protein
MGISLSLVSSVEIRGCRSLRRIVVNLNSVIWAPGPALSTISSPIIRRYGGTVDVMHLQTRSVWWCSCAGRVYRPASGRRHGYRPLDRQGSEGMVVERAEEA